MTIAELVEAARRLSTAREDQYVLDFVAFEEAEHNINSEAWEKFVVKLAAEMLVEVRK